MFFCEQGKRGRWYFLRQRSLACVFLDGMRENGFDAPNDFHTNWVLIKKHA